MAGSRTDRTGRTSSTGFTLIELLVVIAIIALLMSILMPALSRVKKQAQMVACMSNLKSWGLLFKLYTDDYEGYFNEGFGYNDHHGQSNELGLWMNALRPYYNDEWDLLTCPTATRPVEGPGDWGTFKAWVRTNQANRYPKPGEGSTIDFTASYGINSWTNYMISSRGHRPVDNFWKSTQNVPNPSTVPLFGDSTWNDAWPWSHDEPIEQPLDFHWGSPGTSGEMNHFCLDRHNGFMNMTFVDWSVQKVGLKELWTLKWHRAYDVTGPWTRAGGVAPTDWPQWLRKYKDY